MHPAPVDYFKMTNDMINIFFNRYMVGASEDHKAQLARIAADVFRGMRFDVAVSSWLPADGVRAFPAEAVANLGVK